MSQQLIELESSKWATQSQETFKCMKETTFSGKWVFEVYCRERDFVFLDLCSYADYKYGVAKESKIGLATCVGALGFGMVGASVGQMIDNSKCEGRKSPRRMENHSCYTPSELAYMVKQRKRSFVLPHDQIKRADFSAPGGMQLIFVTNEIQGRLQIRAKSRIDLEFFGADEMQGAIDSMQRLIGDRVTAKVAFHKQRRRFVRTR
jgi:hypothetical protein